MSLSTRDVTQMTTATETDVEQVDEQAQAWLYDKFEFDSNGQVFHARDMVTAYRAGFAAGLAHARKVFMAEPL